MEKIKTQAIRIISLWDWDELITTVYNRPYSLQQQRGCLEKQLIEFSVPSLENYDDEMEDDIPEELDGEMGVKFATWLARNPNTPIKNQKEDYELELFWERNFYPDFGTIVNDLHNKGYIDEGDYGIIVDW